MQSVCRAVENQAKRGNQWDRYARNIQVNRAIAILAAKTLMAQTLILLLAVTDSAALGDWDLSQSVLGEEIRIGIAEPLDHFVMATTLIWQ